jgi:trk system potassium uptake protein TrkA
VRILIVGAGAVGYNLARMLAVESHDVGIVEENRGRVRRIRDKLDVQLV